MTPPATLFKPRAAMARAPIPRCHGGTGAVDSTTVLDAADLAGRRLKFVHDDILPPGASVGPHPHADDEELYVILSGQGEMELDGQVHPVAAGDAVVVFPGGTHALRNTGAAPLRLLVVCLQA